MTLYTMPGLQDHDTVEPSMGGLFTSAVLVRVTRRIGDTTLVAVVPHEALARPWPTEFLFRPLRMLGAVPVWWSLHRHSSGASDLLESTYLTADNWHSTQVVPVALVSDAAAWEAFKPYQFRRMMWDYQDAMDLVVPDAGDPMITQASAAQSRSPCPPSTTTPSPPPATPTDPPTHPPRSATPTSRSPH